MRKNNLNSVEKEEIVVRVVYAVFMSQLYSEIIPGGEVEDLTQVVSVTADGYVVLFGFNCAIVKNDLVKNV